MTHTGPHRYADGRPYRTPQPRLATERMPHTVVSTSAVHPYPAPAEVDWRRLWQETEQRLLACGFAQSTLHLYRRVLRTLYTYATKSAQTKLQANRPLSVSTHLVSAFLHAVNNRHVSWSWLASHIGVLRTVFDKLAGLNVTQGIRTPKRASRLPDILSSDEVRRLLELAGTLRDRLIIGLMYGCGLRVAEVCALRWSAVDIAQNVLRIVNAHSGHSRQLSIPGTLRDVLTMGAQRCSGTDHVFPGANPGKALTARVMERHIASLAIKAGLTKPVSCRTLRHSYAVECLRLGMSVEQLRVNLGHLHIESTLIYQRCLPHAGLVSPTDALPSSKPEAIRAPATHDETTDASAVPSSPDLPSNIQPIAVPFQGLADNATGFFAMLRARLHDRFLALKAFVNSS